MDARSIDPTLGSVHVDDEQSLNVFLQNIISEADVDLMDHELDFTNEKFDSNFFFDNIPRDDIQNKPIKYDISGSTGSLSPNQSSLSMSPQSSRSLDSPRQEFIEVPKLNPTEITIATKNTVNNSKRRKSPREAKPTPKLKKARVEKADKLPVKLELNSESNNDSDIELDYEPNGSSMELTAEEQDVLAQNGWDPTDQNLKKARRKIKNKISAQQSRIRKRDQLNHLQKNLHSFELENNQLKSDLEKEKASNKTLMSQVRELQQVINQRFQGKNVKTATTQTSAAVMVVLLCFTVFKGSWSNQEDEEAMLHGNLNEDFDYTTPPYKSRLLKCFGEDDIDFCTMDGDSLPTIKFDEDDDNDLSWVQSEISKMSLVNKNLDAAEYRPGTLVNIAQKVFENDTSSEV